MGDFNLAAEILMEKFPNKAKVSKLTQELGYSKKIAFYKKGNPRGYCQYCIRMDGVPVNKLLLAKRKAFTHGRSFIISSGWAKRAVVAVSNALRRSQRFI